MIIGNIKVSDVPCIIEVIDIASDIEVIDEQWVTVNVLKFLTLVAGQKRIRQTVQTQIKLLLKRQSDQGLPSLLF